MVRWGCRSLVSDGRISGQWKGGFFSLPSLQSKSSWGFAVLDTVCWLRVPSYPNYAPRGPHSGLDVTEMLLMRFTHERLGRKKRAEAIFLPFGAWQAVSRCEYGGWTVLCSPITNFRRRGRVRPALVSAVSQEQFLELQVQLIRCDLETNPTSIPPALLTLCSKHPE